MEIQQESLSNLLTQTKATEMHCDADAPHRCWAMIPLRKSVQQIWPICGRSGTPFFASVQFKVGTVIAAHSIDN